MCPDLETNKWYQSQLIKRNRNSAYDSLGRALVIELHGICNSKHNTNRERYQSTTRRRDEGIFDSIETKGTKKGQQHIGSDMQQRWSELQEEL